MQATRFDRDNSKELSLPALHISNISYLDQIDDLKKQLGLKNQVIKDLSVKLLEMNTQN